VSPLHLIALGGMLVLAGVAVLFRALRPSPPRLSAVMAQLNAQPARAAAPVGNVGSAPERSWVPAAAIAFAERHLGARDEDLAILGRSRADLAGTKLGWAAGGALFPGLLSLILALGGIRMPFAIPAVACVVLAVLAWANTLPAGRRGRREGARGVPLRAGRLPRVGRVGAQGPRVARRGP